MLRRQAVPNSLSHHLWKVCFMTCMHRLLEQVFGMKYLLRYQQHRLG